MANLNKEIKKAEEDIHKLREETVKLIQDLNTIQKSAASIRGRLGKAVSIAKTKKQSRKRNSSRISFKLSDLHEQIESVPEDLASALKTLKEVRAWLKIN